MEAEALAWFSDITTRYMQAQSDARSIEEKIKSDRSRSLRKFACLQAAKKLINHHVKAQKENLDSLRSVLGLPLDHMEEEALNQLKVTKKKYIRAICDAKSLQTTIEKSRLASPQELADLQAKKKALEQDKQVLGERLNNISRLLRFIRGEADSSSEDDESDDEHS